MNTVLINNVEYYLTTELMNTDKEYFKCCKGKPRAIIEWKKIPSSELIYAYQKDNSWIVSKKEYNKALLLLTKTFCEANLPSMKKAEPEPRETEVEKKVKSKPMDAPPILPLMDIEKFKDEQGNPLEIEVRGERSYDKIYFKVKDVALAFNIMNLSDTISRDRTKYVINEDYQQFSIATDNVRADRNIVKFLTYQGVIRTIFTSRCGNAYKFVKWATEVLFTHQMGTNIQKKQLACDLVGVPYSDLKKYLNIHTNITYCIYLSIIGKVSELRSSMNINAEIDDNKFVCKFGKTDNLEERMKHHRQEYKKIKGANWHLKKISMIEPFYGFKAETELKNFVKHNKLEYETYQELIVLDNEELNRVEEKMTNLRCNFGTSSQEMAGLVEIVNRNLEKERFNSEKEKYLRETEAKIWSIEKEKFEFQLKLKEQELENRTLQLENFKLKYQ